MKLENKKSLLAISQSELKVLQEMLGKATTTAAKSRLNEQIIAKHKFIKSLRDEMQKLQGMECSKPRHPAPSNVAGSASSWSESRLQHESRLQESKQAKALRMQAHEQTMQLQAMAKAVRMREHEERMAADVERANVRRKGFVQAAKLNLPQSVFEALMQQAVGFELGNEVRAVTWFGRLRLWVARQKARHA